MLINLWLSLSFGGLMWGWAIEQIHALSKISQYRLTTGPLIYQISLCFGGVISLLLIQIPIAQFCVILPTLSIIGARLIYHVKTQVHQHVQQN